MTQKMRIFYKNLSKFRYIPFFSFTIRLNYEMKNNFYRAVDKEGKMPVLCKKEYDIPETHPYFIRYKNNKPVSYRGQEDVLFENGKVYDYSINEFVYPDNLLKE